MIIGIRSGYIVKFLSVWLPQTVVAVALCCWISAVAADERVVRLGADEYPPYMDSTRADQGLLGQLVTAALHHSGYRVSIEFYPAKRTFFMVKRGHLDGILAGHFWKEREGEFVISDELMRSEDVLVARASSNIRFSSVEALEPYTIGVIRNENDAMRERYEALHHLTLHTVSNHDQNLKMLLSGRVDLIITKKPVFQYLMKAVYPELASEVKILDPALSDEGVYTLISTSSPQHKQIIEALNRGLRQMRKDGRYQSLMQEFGVTH